MSGSTSDGQASTTCLAASLFPNTPACSSVSRLAKPFPQASAGPRLSPASQSAGGGQELTPLFNFGRQVTRVTQTSPECPPSLWPLYYLWFTRTAVSRGQAGKGAERKEPSSLWGGREAGRPRAGPREADGAGCRSSCGSPSLRVHICEVGLVIGSSRK